MKKNNKNSKKFVNGMRVNGPGDITVKARVRGPDGKIVEKRANVKTKEEGKKKIEEMKATIRNGPGSSSLDVSNVTCKTIADLIDFYNDHHRENKSDWCKILLKKEIGEVRKEDALQKFTQYFEHKRCTPCDRTGKYRSGRTLNAYIATISSVFNYCKVINNQPYTGITINPFSDFEKYPENERDRVFEGEERKRLGEVMVAHKSRLLKALEFSEKNPIRRDDLINLKKDDIYYENGEPVVKFYARKTKRRRPVKTNLVCIDDSMLSYWKSLPGDCPWLFPVLTDDGAWRQLRISDFRKHWKKMLKLANIEDFTWHDIKHVGMTYMLNHGFTNRSIKGLKIAFTDRMINRYDNNNAKDIIDNISSIWKKNAA